MPVVYRSKIAFDKELYLSLYDFDHTLASQILKRRSV